MRLPHSHSSNRKDKDREKYRFAKWPNNFFGIISNDSQMASKWTSVPVLRSLADHLIILLGPNAEDYPQNVSPMVLCVSYGWLKFLTILITRVDDRMLAMHFITTDIELVIYTFAVIFTEMMVNFKFIVFISACDFIFSTWVHVTNHSKCL